MAAIMQFGTSKSRALLGILIVSGAFLIGYLWNRDTAKPKTATLVEPASAIDSIVFGDGPSEQAHTFKEERSEVLRGGLDEPARRLLPGGEFPWQGGAFEWNMKIDPKKQNYVTVKLWGSDKGHDAGRLMLFANGMQVGYRHESDYDVLNMSDHEAQAPGRFVYVTLPLPPALTQGKTDIALKIQSLGPIWFYGENFARYQRSLTQPTRGIYQAYTHTTERFVPAASEKQGKSPEAPLRKTTGPEVVEASRQTVISRLSGMLSNKKIPGNLKSRNADLLLLCEAYQTRWTPAYQDSRTIDRIIRIGDAIAEDFTKDPKIIDAEWTGTGALGQAIFMTWPDIRQRLEEMMPTDAGTIRRAEAWLPMLKYSVNHWRTHRRPYTNQSMIVDAGIYGANRALALIDPASAIPESRALDFLHQATGAKPWLGSDTADGGSEAPYGHRYHLITRKGLSRELGYVGSYGETILPFTCDMARLTGDPVLREQARKMQLARLIFRYPAVDADGYRCMKLASEIDNRTAHYPHPGSAYNAPAVREAWWMETASLLSDDPVIVGAAQQSVEEGQYFNHIQSRLKDADLLGMMRNVGNWEIVSRLPKSEKRLPMTPGQPDFAFADEENGVLAFMQGDTLMFVNLYYRAERGVNRVARIFELTPDITRIATVRTNVEIIESGETYTRPDWIDRIRNKGITPPNQTIRQAWAGEKMPIAKRPDDAKSPKYGDWGPFVGKAAFYSLHYGRHLIGMNTTEDRTYTLQVPAGVKQAKDLVSGKVMDVSKPVQIAPLSTVILDVGSGAVSDP